jgi:hypothetical protein
VLKGKVRVLKREEMCFGRKQGVLKEKNMF